MINSFDQIVNKYHLSIGHQYTVEIPDMGRDQLAQLFAELNFTQGAEIGVEKGIYSEILLQANPQLYLYSVDPWDASAYEPNIATIDYSQQHYDRCYRVAQKTLSSYSCQIIRKQSMEAVKEFAASSLDFVYIDGNHDFVNVSNDIHAWQKKVRPGGIIAGHDFAYFPSGKHNHVKYVVLAYTNAYGIRPLFIVGAEVKGQPGVIRNKFRSWFLVKQ